jgi:hypothetical protein
MRITNHDIDMSHSHHAEKLLKPEMSVKPSALWQKRRNFETTAASLRGVQLLGSIRGKREDQKVFADTLVDKHDFHNSLQDTVWLSCVHRDLFGIAILMYSLYLLLQITVHSTYGADV